MIVSTLSLEALTALLILSLVLSVFQAAISAFCFSDKRRVIAYNLGCAALGIFLFNKYLLGSGVNPFSYNLTIMFIACSITNAVLYGHGLYKEWKNAKKGN